MLSRELALRIWSRLGGARLGGGARRGRLLSMITGFTFAVLFGPAEVSVLTCEALVLVFSVGFDGALNLTAAAPFVLLDLLSVERWLTSVDVTALLCFLPFTKLGSERLSIEAREALELTLLLTLVCFLDCQDFRFGDIDGWSTFSSLNGSDILERPDAVFRGSCVDIADCLCCRADLEEAVEESTSDTEEKDGDFRIGVELLLWCEGERFGLSASAESALFKSSSSSTMDSSSSSFSSIPVNTLLGGFGGHSAERTAAGKIVTD